MVKWKYIKGYGKRYMVSDTGLVKSFMRNKKGDILNTHSNGLGYKYIGLYNKKKRKNHYVHRLVAEHHLKKINNAEVNHKDLDKSNNNVDNLEWVTKSDNHKHAYTNGKKWQLNNAPAT